MGFVLFTYRAGTECVTSADLKCTSRHISSTDDCDEIKTRVDVGLEKPFGVIEKLLYAGAVLLEVMPGKLMKGCLFPALRKAAFYLKNVHIKHYKSQQRKLLFCLLPGKGFFLVLFFIYFIFFFYYFL